LAHQKDTKREEKIISRIDAEKTNDAQCTALSSGLLYNRKKREYYH
jgi:hypothetical protein